jgi:hypothetical protein
MAKIRFTPSRSKTPQAEYSKRRRASHLPNKRLGQRRYEESGIVYGNLQGQQLVEASNYYQQKLEASLSAEAHPRRPRWLSSRYSNTSIVEDKRSFIRKAIDSLTNRQL